MGELRAALWLRQIRQLVRVPAREGATDADLLEQFLRRRDETAFSQLVERHGPMVQAVCRRVLGDVHEAEDVSQAAFLVLAKKASAIRDRGAVAAWLHGVALRLACHARGKAARRPLPTLQEEPMSPCPASQVAAAEARQALDEELQRLPSRYRAPLVLCCLEGKTRGTAAAELGCSEGAVRGLLDRGRDMLQRRLTRRGVTLSAGLIALLNSTEAPAGLPAGWSSSVAQAAMRFTAPGGVAATGNAAVLARQALHGMAAARWKAVLVAVTLAMSAAVGVKELGGFAFLAAPDVAPAQPAQGEPASVAPRTDALGDPLPPGAVARMGTLRFFHRNGNYLCWLGDGKMIATLGSEVRLWEAATGRELQTIQAHGRAAALSPDGQTIASGDRDGLGLWATATGKKLRALPEKHEIFELSFSPDGKTLASGGTDGVLRLWDVNVGELRHEIKAHADGIYHVRFTARGDVVTAGPKDDVRVWDAGAGRERFHFPPQADAIDVSRDGKTLLTCGHDNVIRFWNLENGKEQGSFPGPESVVMGLSWSPDGKTLATASPSESCVRLWSVPSGKPVRTLPAPGHLLSIRFSPDGKTLAAGDPSVGDGRIRLWDADSGEERAGPPRHHGDLLGLRFTADANTLVTAGNDGTVRFWEAATGREKRQRSLPAAGRRVLALSPDGRYAVASGPWPVSGAGNQLDQGLGLWDLAAEKEIRRVEKLGASAYVAAFSPDGSTAAVGTLDNFVVMWETGSGKELGRFPASCKSVAFSPDVRTVAAGGWDCAVRLLDVRTGKERQRLGEPVDRNRERDGTFVEGITAVAFSADGQFLAGAEVRERVISIWRLTDGKRIVRITGGQRGWQEEEVHALAFSPDGKTLASGGGDRTIRLWETATGQERRSLPGHRGAVSSLNFSPDGGRLASGSRDETALVWDVYALAGSTEAGAIDRCWKELVGLEPAKAHDTMCWLIAHPDQALDAARGRLSPVEAPAPDRIKGLLADLDGPKFDVREKATRELEALGDLAGPALAEALTRNPSPEGRVRLEALLEKLKEARPTPEQVGALRPVELLERIGRPDAVALLERLAGGAAGAPLTRVAKAALVRLENRSKKP